MAEQHVGVDIPDADIVSEKEKKPFSLKVDHEPII